jgi:chemotaxis protein CheD
VAVFIRDNLPKCLDGFEHINRYHDANQDIMTAKILPGEFYVSNKGEMISTVLGSCISACIRDPIAGIGGMNHFMLPIDRRAKARGDDYDPGIVTRYGDFAMEMLINSILRAGGKRKNLEVKVFGGGKVISHMTSMDVGNKNINFVHEYLEFEGIKITAEDTGDIYPRKVNYFSDTGRVTMKKLVIINNDTIAKREDSYYSDIVSKTDSTSELEMFK